MKRYVTLVVPVLLLCLAAPVPSAAANLANPAAQAGDARAVFGASYFIGGAEITNDTIPMMMNRFCARVTFSPIRYANLGVDFGAAQVSVDSTSAVSVFEGEVGYSLGGHVKLSSPYIADLVSVLAIGNANYFSSTNSQGAYYDGIDIVAAAGLQFRIPDGAVSIGPQFYVIMGKNRDCDVDNETRGKAGTYSNLNNMRAWAALDYFPERLFAGTYKPYVSLEFTASPRIRVSSRIPFQEFSVSVSVGAITRRLYGTGNDIED